MNNDFTKLGAIGLRVKLIKKKSLFLKKKIAEINNAIDEIYTIKGNPDNPKYIPKHTQVLINKLEEDLSPYVTEHKKNLKELKKLKEQFKKIFQSNSFFSQRESSGIDFDKIMKMNFEKGVNMFISIFELGTMDIEDIVFEIILLKAEELSIRQAIENNIKAINRKKEGFSFQEEMYNLKNRPLYDFSLNNKEKSIEKLVSENEQLNQTLRRYDEIGKLLYDGYIDFQKSEKKKPLKIERELILILSANPNGSTLRLDREMREIENELTVISLNREQYKVRKVLATRIVDLQRNLLNYSPRFIHFSGHGSQDGIYLTDDLGDYSVIDNKSLYNLFKIFSSSIQCIFLNSCYSETQAKSLGNTIPYVIGMRKEVDDSSAIEFSTTFYRAISAGKEIEFAFEVAKNSLDLNRLNGSDIPILLKNGRQI